MKKQFHTFPELARRFEQGKRQIRKDIRDGIVPKSVDNFSDLDLYVDANYYGGLCAKTYRISKDFVFENTLQSMFDKFLKEGGHLI